MKTSFTITFNSNYEIEKGHDCIEQIKSLGFNSDLFISNIKNNNEFTITNKTIKLTTHKEILDNKIITFSYFQKSNPNNDKFLILGEMTSNIMHDIATPLDVSISSLELLKLNIVESEIDQEDKDKFLKYVRSSEDGIEKISQISQSVLNVLRNKKQTPRNINLVSLLEETTSFLGTQFAKNKIDFTISIKDHISKNNFDYLCMDTFISQVYFNLIKNSCDAIAENADFSKWIEFKFDINKNFIKIYCIDGGTGIPKDIANNIFDKQFTTKDAGKGTGLGLSFTKKIIEEHGGTIKINNECRNTCFEISLPIKK
jgi:signal transduction histidine kinase